MPQMAPINWLSLFFLMSAIFLMINLLNYFSFNLTFSNKKYNNDNSNNNNNKVFTWKW